MNTRSYTVKGTIMDLDNFTMSEYDEAEAEAARERQLVKDEQPLDFEGADDCGDACKI